MVERKETDRAGDTGGLAAGGCGQDEGKYFRNTDFYANSHRSSIRAPSSISDGEILGADSGAAGMSGVLTHIHTHTMTHTPLRERSPIVIVLLIYS